MAFVTTKFDGAVSHKISYHSNMTNTVTVNLTGGPGSLHSIKIANTNDAAVFVKIANAHTATSGSTAPDWIFPVPLQARILLKYQMVSHSMLCLAGLLKMQHQQTIRHQVFLAMKRWL